MNTFVTILVEHVEGADESTLIPSDGCVRLYPVAPVKDGSVLTHKGVGVQLADGRPVDGGVWVWPGRYVVGAAGRRWEVDIPAGHTAEAPFNLATAVPVDPASPLPWAPTAEDLLLVKETAALIESGDFGGGDGPGRPGADGVSVLSIADEDGDGTATVTYSDGRSEPLPLPRGLQGEPGRDGIDGEPGRDGVDGRNGADSTVPGPPGPATTLTIGTVTTGAQAAATITGDAPAQTLSLVLPKAERGEPGPPGAPGGTYVPSSDLVGPGRPDQPATTGGLVTGQETVGTIYRSTDGAGVGAWAWRKRPSGWVVTDGDTGWRTLTDSVQTPWQGADRGGVGRGGHNIRRVGTQIHWLTYWYRNTGGNGVFGTIPTGFKLPVSVPGGGYGAQEAGRSGSTILTIRNGDRLVVSGHSTEEIRIYATWSTAEPWPTILPGTPA